MITRVISCVATAMLVLAAPAAFAGGSGLLLKPHEQTGGILAVDEAFRVQPALWENGQLVIGIDAAPNCYLYRDKFKLSVVEPASLSLISADLPAGETHHDEHFGDVKIIRDRLLVRYKTAASAAPKKVRIRYQGCAENLVCYPPQERVLDVETVR
ncbi:protein-disulfide reductase DsbD N-terminal domain-containing protein [Hydrocarboniphaga sp.]|uniref:protein-disulfide reductase DsbD N-terminal domain-containing protein n=1 Tax=Hydrocarboniphaga sp. TaxID=2033016 RepID=UPI003D0B9C96